MSLRINNAVSDRKRDATGYDVVVPRFWRYASAIICTLAVTDVWHFHVSTLLSLLQKLLSNRMNFHQTKNSIMYIRSVQFIISKIERKRMKNEAKLYSECSSLM